MLCKLHCSLARAAVLVDLYILSWIILLASEGHPSNERLLRLSVPNIITWLTQLYSGTACPILHTICTSWRRSTLHLPYLQHANNNSISQGKLAVLFCKFSLT